MAARNCFKALGAGLALVGGLVGIGGYGASYLKDGGQSGASIAKTNATLAAKPTAAKPTATLTLTVTIETDGPNIATCRNVNTKTDYGPIANVFGCCMASDYNSTSIITTSNDVPPSLPDVPFNQDATSTILMSFISLQMFLTLLSGLAQSRFIFPKTQTWPSRKRLVEILEIGTSLAQIESATDHMFMVYIALLWLNQFATWLPEVPDARMPRLPEIASVACILGTPIELLLISCYALCIESGVMCGVVADIYPLLDIVATKLGYHIHTGGMKQDLCGTHGIVSGYPLLGLIVKHFGFHVYSMFNSSTVERCWSNARRACTDYYDDTLGQLTITINKLKDDIITTEKSNSDGPATLSTFQARLDSMDTIVQDATAKAQDTFAEVQDTKSKAKDTCSKLQKTTDDLELLNTSHEHTAASHADTAAKVAGVMKDVDTLQTIIDDERLSRKQAKEVAEGLEHNQQTLEDRYRELRKDAAAEANKQLQSIDKRCSNFDSLRSNHNQLKDNFDVAQEVATALGKQVIDLKNDHDKKEKAIVSLTTKTGTAEKKAAKIEKDVAGGLQTNETQGKRIHELEQLVQSLQKTHSTPSATPTLSDKVSAQLHDLQASLNGMKKENEELRGRIGKVEHDTRTSTDKNKELESTVEDLHGKTDQVRTESRSNKDEIDEQRGEIEALQGKVDECTSTNDQLQLDVDEAKNESEMAQLEAEQAKTMNEELRGLVEEAENNSQQAHATLREAITNVPVHCFHCPHDFEAPPPSPCSSTGRGPPTTPIPTTIPHIPSAAETTSSPLETVQAADLFPRAAPSTRLPPRSPSGSPIYPGPIFSMTEHQRPLPDEATTPSTTSSAPRDTSTPPAPDDQVAPPPTQPSSPTPAPTPTPTPARPARVGLGHSQYAPSSSAPPPYTSTPPAPDNQPALRPSAPAPAPTPTPAPPPTRRPQVGLGASSYAPSNTTPSSSRPAAATRTPAAPGTAPRLAPTPAPHPAPAQGAYHMRYNPDGPHSLLQGGRPRTPPTPAPAPLRWNPGTGLERDGRPVTPATNAGAPAAPTAGFGASDPAVARAFAAAEAAAAAAIDDATQREIARADAEHARWAEVRRNGGKFVGKGKSAWTVDGTPRKQVDE